MYVLQRVGGAFVADMSRSRRGGSYTWDLREAKTFITRESAEHERCPGNEVVVELHALLSEPR